MLEVCFSAHPNIQYRARKKEITDAAYVQAQRVIRHLFFSLHASLLTHKVPAPQLSVCETST